MHILWYHSLYVVRNFLPADLATRHLCNKYWCKKNVQIDSFLLEQIEKKEQIDLASMIFTNSYADREGIEKKEHLIKMFPTSIITPNAPSISY